MPLAQDGITDGTPMGATLVANGATFRVWAPAAEHVYLVLDGQDPYVPDDGDELLRRADGTWTGCHAGVRDGTRYRFCVEGARGRALKRDPRARELEAGDYLSRDGIVRDPDAYPWHDAGFAAPAARDLVVYQLHVGVWYARDAQGRDLRPGRNSTFLDAVQRLPYLAELGVNAVQPLPLDEHDNPWSLGYTGTDMFSPEVDYSVPDSALPPYADAVNELLASKGQPPLSVRDLVGGYAQLKALVDLCHLHGIAVIADVVYNHAKGGEPLGQFDMADRDLYFTAEGVVDGLAYDYAKDGVRDFLIQHALTMLGEYHVDGLRCDEVSIIVRQQGQQFCRDLTRTVHFAHRRAILIAEFWGDPAWAVRSADGPSDQAGLGFDVAYSDRLREAIRGVISGASGGADTPLDLWRLCRSVYPPPGMRADQTYTCIENHDLPWDYGDHKKPRVPALACGGCERTWWGQSRTRVATGLLLCAPGVPMLFMGQDLLAHNLWSDDPNNSDDLIRWDELDGPNPTPQVEAFNRFLRELIWLRRRHPALRDEGVRVLDPDMDNRVVAFERWVPGVGRNTMVICTLAEQTLRGYRLGMPLSGTWKEVFNSDAYDPDPRHPCDGNAGQVIADGPPLHGYGQSAALTIPANGIVVFARDNGDA
jgi:1,4-alpha-glucan branching enzyme